MLLPEFQLAVSMLGRFSENMMLEAKWRRPRIIRLLADAGREFSMLW
jgi:hypothetical protein